MQSLNRKNILKKFLALPEKQQMPFRMATDHLKYFMVLWGMDDPKNVVLSSNQKRHYLWVYRTLGLIWFAILPDNDNDKFTIFVNQQIPPTVNPDRINETYLRPTEELQKLGARQFPPAWTKEKNAMIPDFAIDD